MGTSSVDIWDNDDAADWIVDLLDTDDLGVLRDSLQPAEVEGRYLEAPEGARILCAADTVRAALHSGQSTVPGEVLEWVRNHASLDFRSLVPEALAKTRRVLANQSEVRELWEENQELFPAWISQVEALVASLGS